MAESAKVDARGKPVLAYLHGKEGAATHLQRKVYKDSIKTSIGSSVPQAKRKVDSDGPFHRTLWLRWMNEATKAGRAVHEASQKETPRTKWKTFEGDESWLFTTFEAIGVLSGADKLQGIVKEGEGAGPGWRQLSNGSYVFLVPPCEASRVDETLADGITLSSNSVVITTVTVPRSNNTSPITTCGSSGR